jgi:hypothetical protein
LPGDGNVDFELFELCKVYSGQTGAAVVFDVSVDAENDANTANDPADFQVTLNPGECRDIWTDGGPTQDKVTVTEVVPSGYTASYVKTTLVRAAGVPDAVVVGSSTPGNSMSEAFSGDTPAGVVGVLVVFTNTFVPPPPGGEGCTPGFWKNRGLGLGWPTYDPADDFDTVFGVASTYSLTLLEALNKGGGGEYYDLTEAEVIAAVQDAYATGDFEGVKDNLEGFNTQTAPGFCD